MSLKLDVLSFLFIVELFFILVIIENCLCLGLIKFLFFWEEEVIFFVIFYRREWVVLGNMFKEDVMVEFVKFLNRCCYFFLIYVVFYKIEKEE